MSGMDFLCPKLRARLEGKEIPKGYQYDLESSENKKPDYGGMGVPIKLIVCNDQEANAMIRAALGNKLVGNLYGLDKKK